jgi:cytidylate kinase
MVVGKVPVIAIDGPSASGKGTIAQKVAQQLGFHYLDSGTLYRLVGLVALRHARDLDNESDLSAIASRLKVKFLDGRVELEGADVTDEIRRQEIGDAASRVAALPGVRAALLGRQRAFRRPPGLVADGRDMGSVVFPDAALKIYLTASPEERALRRYKQLMDKGMSASMDALLREIRERDARDSARAVAPLQKCADAVELDTTGMSIEAVVTQVLSQYHGAQ